MEGTSSSPAVDWVPISLEGLQLQDRSNPKEKAIKFRKADQEVNKCLGVKGAKEIILKSYSCAWQKDILVHGRLYLTQNWICFYSNILGWETKTCINIKDLTAITKQKTALVIPNAILLETCNRKFGFTSFVHRDRAYQVMQLIWENSHLHRPCTAETLKIKLSQLYYDRHSNGSRRSSSFTEEVSDLDTFGMCPTSLSLPDCGGGGTSTTATPTSDVSEGSEEMTTLTDHTDSVYRGQTTNTYSSSESGSESLVDSEKSSSLAREGSSNGNCSSTGSDPSPLEQCHNRSQNHKLNAESTAPVIISPNFLPWKQTLISVSAVFHRVLSTRFYSHLRHSCCSNSTRIINIFIILVILLLLASTISMVCRLSEVEPALQPYLCLQPWCPYTRLKLT